MPFQVSVHCLLQSSNHYFQFLELIACINKRHLPGKFLVIFSVNVEVIGFLRTVYS